MISKSDIEQDKLHTQQLLKDGLAKSCADDIIEAIINMQQGTCDYSELIPLLEEIAKKDTFYYFDDNGAGGQPHADLRRKTDFLIWAQRVIDNLKENAKFEADGIIAEALKSNNTNFIRTTLEHLKSEGTCSNKLLIPILEKIARKDEYKSYTYLTSFETDCRLGELAYSVIKLIRLNTESHREDHAADQRYEYRLCTVCSSLPEDFTVNTGREERFPSAFSQLVHMTGDNDTALYRCPACHTFYEWINMPQFYGSGNCDEERLVRQTPENSRELDHSFSAD
jgi:hypothetical protein